MMWYMYIMYIYDMIYVYNIHIWLKHTLFSALHTYMYIMYIYDTHTHHFQLFYLYDVLYGIHVCLYIYMHIYIHTYIHIYIHVWYGYVCKYEYDICIMCKYEYDICIICKYEYDICIICKYEYDICIMHIYMCDPGMYVNMNMIYVCMLVYIHTYTYICL